MILIISMETSNNNIYTKEEGHTYTHIKSRTELNDTIRNKKNYKHLTTKKRCILQLNRTRKKRQGKKFEHTARVWFKQQNNQACSRCMVAVSANRNAFNKKNTPWAAVPNPLWFFFHSVSFIYIANGRWSIWIANFHTMHTHKHT